MLMLSVNGSLGDGEVMPIFSYFYALYLEKVAKNNLQRHALSCSDDTQTPKLRGNYLNAENMNEVQSSIF